MTLPENDVQTPADQPEVQRKKRLSRKDQKARKKQRTKLQQQSQQAPSSNAEAQQQDATTTSTSKKKSKKKKNKKGRNKNAIERQANDDNKTNKTDASTTPSATLPTESPWKPQDLQEDIPYIPTPLPDAESSTSDKHQQPTARSNNKNDKTLGKWFPKARVMKSQPSATNDCTILLFYQYKSPVVWSEPRVASLIRYLQAIFEARPTLGGRLRVAPEGINATLSCGDTLAANGRTILHHFTRDLQQFDDMFFDTDFKYIPAKADRHFKDLKILPVQELVFYGIKEQQAPLTATGVHLEAKDFHEMLHDTSKDTVVIDVRNHYEAALGRFDGQERQATRAKNKETTDGNRDDKSLVKSGGAKYIDPQMRKSTDWTSWLEKSAEDLKGKRVMLYCTGGVRCERASAYLNKTMGDELEGVYQLQGGIERYLQAFPDGGYWTGRNFVFDKREAVSATDPNGDGGVLPGKKKHTIADGIETKCCLCDRPWDRYVGKRKCDTCGVPVLMCDTCMSSTRESKKKKNKKSKADDGTANTGSNHEKNKDDGARKLARCDLCVEQDITVPVEEVEYTDNGVKSKSHSDHGKAAPSVLKWGGGHASEKKERRRKQPRKRAASMDEPQV